MRFIAKRKATAQHRAAIEPYFDSEFYKSQCGRPTLSNRKLLDHYLRIGWKAGLDPSADFSSTGYFLANPDVLEARHNPLLHFALHGQKEGRRPKPDFAQLERWREIASVHFDEAYYVSQLEEDLFGIRPIDHYLLMGWLKGLNPSPDFDSDFYLRANPDIAASGVNPLVHWISYGRNEGRLSTNVGFSDIYEVAWREGLFDPNFYLSTYSDVARRKTPPLRHYKVYGWQELRNPSATFDAAWYHLNYLAGTEDKVDPLAHYITFGKERGYRTKPPLPSSVREVAVALPTNPKRVCLFAGYDADGIVDETVISYISTLSKFADVYYLADSNMDDSELDKLRTFVKGSWALRHGNYDFGSWSLLARDFVGWDILETYDELLLVNDSAFLVKSLDQVFKVMGAKSCAFWGLQSTKGMAATFESQGLPGVDPVKLSSSKPGILDKFELDPIYDFHIGSYFVGFRKPVICNEQFRRILNSVEKEPNKSTLIRKFEIGITHWLISQGFSFETFIDEVYPVQPVYTEHAFKFIERGFPLFKRYLLTENHYNVPYLDAWRDRLRVAGVELNLDPIWRNTVRHSHWGKLHKNLRLGAGSDGNAAYLPALTVDKIPAYDQRSPKFGHWWSFPVCAYTNSLDDNTRAVFEHVRDDPSVKKIILTRGKPVNLRGKNVVVVRKDSRLGQYYMSRSAHVFLKHTVRANFGNEWSAESRHFYNLWHGIPLKRIGYTSLDRIDLLSDTADQNRRLKAVISASDVDRLAMTAAHYPLSYHDIWKTGLPRHDFILMDAQRLPSDLREQEERLKCIMAGRKLIFFAPTFRNDQVGGYYRFSADEVERLVEWLNQHDAVLGIREHMADKARQYSSQLKGPQFLDLSSRRFPDVEMIYRNSEMLITDYSSAFIDFLLTRRPVISFAFDAAAYSEIERGLFYDLEWAFPGSVVQSFSDLMNAIDQAYHNIDPDASYLFKRKIYCDFEDTNNSKRVIEHVRACPVPHAMMPTAIGGPRKRDVVALIGGSADRSQSLEDRIVERLSAAGISLLKVEAKRAHDINPLNFAGLVFLGTEANDAVLDLIEVSKINHVPTAYVETDSGATWSLSDKRDVDWAAFSEANARAERRAATRTQVQSILSTGRTIIEPSLDGFVEAIS